MNFMTVLPYRTAILTLLALLAFAGNSVLCRLALVDNAIDELSFTIVRLISGAFILYAVLFYRCYFFRDKEPQNKEPQNKDLKDEQPKIEKSNSGLSIRAGSWKGSAMLFIYALLFSLAYVRLDTGVGALILFGTVQITMILYGFINGQRLTLLECLGVLLAILGVAYLLWPSAAANQSTAVSCVGGVLMMVSGVAWGLYSLAGASSKNPIEDTAANFLRTLPMAISLLLLFPFYSPLLSMEGVLLAVASGALTSGIGYAIWYAALPNLSNIQAAVVQLFVPILAAGGGVIFAREPITITLLLSSFMVLGGILLVIANRSKITDNHQNPAET
jgi:drug/metabolite transporter (DMT)-like permease